MKIVDLSSAYVVHYMNSVQICPNHKQKHQTKLRVDLQSPGIAGSGPRSGCQGSGHHLANMQNSTGAVVVQS